jgi:hypothetical protein
MTSTNPARVNPGRADAVKGALTPPAASVPASPGPASPAPTPVVGPLADLAPVLPGMQAQGDVIALPVQCGPDHPAYAHAVRRVPPAGVVLATGAGGHAHTLLADGLGVRVAPDEYGSDRSLGVVFVAPGSVAVLAHDEHADLHLAPGAYVVRRQRQASPYPAVRDMAVSD